MWFSNYVDFTIFQITENHKKGPMEAHKSTRHSFEWTIEKMSELQNMRGILRKKNISCESPVYEFSLSNAKIKLVFFSHP